MGQTYIFDYFDPSPHCHRIATALSPVAFPITFNCHRKQLKYNISPTLIDIHLLFAVFHYTRPALPLTLYLLTWDKLIFLTISTRHLTVTALSPVAFPII